MNDPQDDLLLEGDQYQEDEEEQGFLQKLRKDCREPRVQGALIGLFIATLVIGMTYLLNRAIFSNNLCQGNEIVLVSTPFGYPILTDIKGNLPQEVAQKNYEAIMRKILEPGDTVIDIGSEYGYHTMYMSQLIGNSGIIYSFEPVDHVYRIFNASLRINNIRNVYSYNKLAYSTDTLLWLTTLPDHFTNPTVYLSKENAEKNVDKNNVDMQNMHAVKIDTILYGVTNVKLLKIRGYGTEMAVLMGAQRLIERSPDISIIFHWNKELMGKYGNEAKIVDDFINMKFEFWVIQADGSLSLLTRDQVLRLDAADLLITRHAIE